VTYRDTMSGGINNLYHVTKNSWKKIHSIHVNTFHDKYQDEANDAMAT